jgi:DNA polymerase III sliding clamp (beta) subunit (PCNA family)
MRFTVDRKVLAKTLNALRPWVAGAKSPLPVLAGVRLFAENGVLGITTNRLDAGAEVLVPGSKAEGSDELVRFSHLRDACMGIDDGTLNYEEGRAFGGVTDIRVEVMALSDFPASPGVPEGTIEGNLEAFRAAIPALVVAASTDQQRPILTTVCLEPSGEPIPAAAIATDTYRLVTTPVVLSGFSQALLIPAKELGLVAAEGIEEMRFDKIHVLFWTGSAVRWIRLVEGTYPKWRSLVDVGQPAQTWTVEAAELATALAPMVTASKDLPLRLNFTAATMSMIGGGETIAKAGLPGSYPDDADLIAMNPSYLSQLAKSFTGMLTIGLYGPLKPIIAQNGGGIRHLLMPVRV